MLILFDKKLESHFILGTSQYPSLDCMIKSIEASKTNMVTVSLGRSIVEKNYKNVFWEYIKATNCNILPNTAGCHTADEAVQMAEIARDVFETDFMICLYLS